MDLEIKQRYYRALLAKDEQYNGLFYVGVKTTGIFCHAICPAKKPKFENCEFFTTVKDALLAAYRPCKRCRPLVFPHQQSPTIARLIEAIEQQPERRWKTQDFRALGIDESTARRQFKKRFGMTFVEYARARRMGLAMTHIRNGHSIIEAQWESGYSSGSGFRDAFSKALGEAPSLSKGHVLYATWIDTLLGPMVAISDEDYLYLLEFVDRRGLEKEIERLRIKRHVGILPGNTRISEQITRELTDYLSGALTHFQTPYVMMGTAFEQSVWNALLTIPKGQTCSYSHLAKHINHPQAYRAVARANGKNQLALIIPCHRVINENGELGGYGGGLSRKAWLIEHEKKTPHC